LRREPESPRSVFIAKDRGAGIILLLDDDEEGRSVTVLVLESKYFRVLEAHNGEEALRMARNYKGPIRLLLTDMVVAGIRGCEYSVRLGKSGRRQELSAFQGTA